MPLATSILNLYGYEVIEIEGNNPVIIKARYIAEVFCPFCNSDELRKKDTYIRKLNNESIGSRATKLHLKGHKYHCLKCFRYFNQRFPGGIKIQEINRKLQKRSV